MTKKMQLFGIFTYSQSALHAPGDVFALHREHLAVITVSAIVHKFFCQLVSWMKWKAVPFHP